MTAENHKDLVLNTLHSLREYACQKAAPRGLAIELQYHEEDSSLMRFANSAISLNTNEHLIRLDITVYEGRKRASYALMSDLNRLDEMKKGIDTAVELVGHAQALSYQPTAPVYSQSFSDESGYDPDLAQLGNAERLAHFNQVVAGLETDEIRTSGIFSSGSTISAMVCTTSEHSQLFRHSDAQVIAVLAHNRLKWEAIAEGSAHCKADLDAGGLNRDLATIVDHYQHGAPQQLPLGRYDIVFGAAATADLLTMMRYIGFSGGEMKRGYSFLSEAQVGQPVFSSQFTLSDDPSRPETFPYRRDFYGLPRSRFPLFEQGVFQGFTWAQDDADEFAAQPTGHSVSHLSLVLSSGEPPAAGSLPAARTLQELIAAPRSRDLLYIPYLHYMNIVNPSKGVVTASSRFGALLLRQDGTVAVPYNVRLTQSLLDIFGERVAWLSHQTLAYNTSLSYGRRNPTAIVLPAFVCVNDLEISHSNTTY